MKNSIEFERTFSNSSIDKNDNYEMETLYKETQLEHPRKIIDGKIKRYPFFSWSGFFCCNRYDYSSLGLGYTTYFNTIKLSIIFFLIIFLINLVSIKECTKYNSIYDFKDDNLLKTTLGNTIIKHFNYSHVFCNKSEDCSRLTITLNCNESFIDDIIAIRRHYNIEKDFLIFSDFDNRKEFREVFFSGKYNIKTVRGSGLYINSNIKKMHEYTQYTGPLWFNDSDDDQCDYDCYEYNRNNYDYDNIIDIIYYSCLDKSNYDIDNTYKSLNDFYEKIVVVTLVTLIILIIFYYTYKKSISRDNKEYLKNKIFINDYTLVLHNLKIISDDYNLELNDLISFLNKILKTYKSLFNDDN